MEPATPDPKRPLPPPEKDQPGGDFMLLVLAVVLLVLVGWGATELVQWLSQSFGTDPPAPLGK